MSLLIYAPRSTLTLLKKKGTSSFVNRRRGRGLGLLSLSRRARCPSVPPGDRLSRVSNTLRAGTGPPAATLGSGGLHADPATCPISSRATSLLPPVASWKGICSLSYLWPGQFRVMVQEGCGRPLQGQEGLWGDGVIEGELWDQRTPRRCSSPPFTNEEIRAQGARSRTSQPRSTLYRCRFPRCLKESHLECVSLRVTCVGCNRGSSWTTWHLIGADLEINDVMDHDNKIHFCFIYQNIAVSSQSTHEKT